VAVAVGLAIAVAVAGLNILHVKYKGLAEEAQGHLPGTLDSHVMRVNILFVYNYAYYWLKQS